MKCRLINAAARSSQETDKPQRKGLFRTPPAYRIAPFEDDIMVWTISSFKNNLSFVCQG